MLIECHVAGTSHVNIKEIEPDLLTDAILVLKREPDNGTTHSSFWLLTKEVANLATYHGSKTRPSPGSWMPESCFSDGWSPRNGGRTGSGWKSGAFFAIFNSSRQERHLLPPRTSAKNIPHATHSTGSLPLKVTAVDGSVDRSASHFSILVLRRCAMS